MKIKDVLYGAIKYTAIFALGYYVGGGCEDSSAIKIKKSYANENTSIEKKFEDYETKLNGLEKEVESLKNETR